MCGISGIINFNLKKDQLETRIKFGLKSIYYRGPDKLNYYINNGVSFGTVRLAIENISNGEQPKIDKKNNLVAGFNGEIFNYRSLIKKSSSLQNLATKEKIFIPCPLKNRYENGTTHTLDIPKLFVITCNLFTRSFTNLQSIIQ